MMLVYSVRIDVRSIFAFFCPPFPKRFRKRKFYLLEEDGPPIAFLPPTSPPLIASELRVVLVLPRMQGCYEKDRKMGRGEEYMDLMLIEKTGEFGLIQSSRARVL